MSLSNTGAGGMIIVQATSAKVVGQVLAGKNLDRVLDAVISENHGLSPNERSAVNSISFDTLRHYGLLSAQLDALLSQPVSDAPVRHLLLIALAQLQFSKAAPHAIVDHAVSAIEQMGLARAKALVNAVLRNFLRAPEKFKRERFKVETARYDFPVWWINRVKKEYPNDWESILLCARDHPPMWLRINARRIAAEGYVKLLADKGLSVSHYDAHAVCLETPVPVHDLPGFGEGLFSVQDLGAQQAATLLAAQDGMRVLDACAAPGGKTGHLLELANVSLTAIDSDKVRLKRVSDNLRRLQMTAEVRVADASQPGSWWDGKPFDRILLDVPCSGSGVVRRHPDIKWLRRESDIHAFARQQTRLLTALWQCLGNGGRLLYATCSIFRAENGDIVEQFLRKTPNARHLRFEGTDDGLPSVAGNQHAARAPLRDGQLLPDHAHDGFFYALLEKVG